jgi:arginase
MRYLVVPEWQGSPSARAMQLIDGAEAIRGDLPASRTEVVQVPLEAGSAMDTGIHRASSIQMVREAVVATLERYDRIAREGDEAGVEAESGERAQNAESEPDTGSATSAAENSGGASNAEPVLVVGGDCGVALGAIDHASRAHGSDLAVVWFDAHGDLNTPDTSTSAAFGGMVLRAIMGDGAWPLTATHPVNDERIVLAGARSFDDAEAAFIEGSAMTALTVERTTADDLVAAVEASGARFVYVHVDLDVLDPARIAGITGPEPFGVEPATLVEAIVALKERFTLAGASLTGFAPASAEAADDDLGTILRVIGALAR